ncbi:metallophosphoesterase family protein [Paenibacillus hodogayensis]|uniref:Metallophosphoesterase family protein n=1 Tax=Paenibacillus hodogayensis TaxID=279208 RepID=A0ABV5W6K6_9BACL
MMRFVHLTDTHLNAPGKNGQFPTSNHFEKVEQTIRHVRETGVDPEFVLVTGDLSHGGDVEDYIFIRSLFDEASRQLGVPVYVVLGNHDHLSAFRQGYLGESPSEDPFYYVQYIQGLRLIGLNSQVSGQPGGRIDDVQLSWLENQLQTPAPKGTIVALHHPLISLGGYTAKGLLVENREQIARVIAGTDVKGVFAGHVHSNLFGISQGIFHIVAAGTAFTAELEEGRQHFQFVDMCGYNIVTVNEEGIMVQAIDLPRSRTEYMRIPSKGALSK